MAFSDLYLLRSGVTGWQEFVGNSGISATGRSIIFGHPSNYLNILHSGTGYFLQIIGGSGNSCGFADFIGGGSGNSITSSSSNYNVIVGGRFNSINGPSNFIGGGELNRISGSYSFVGAGNGNFVLSLYGSIAGGLTNSVSGDYGFVGAGFGNVASGQASAILAGSFNIAQGQNATVGGGGNNLAFGISSLVGGGESNSTNARATVVCGGEQNATYGQWGAILGGFANVNSGVYGVIVGGSQNAIKFTGQSFSFIGGGSSNLISGNSSNAAILGGNSNSIGFGNQAVIIGSNNIISANSGIAIGFANTNIGTASVVIGSRGRITSVFHSGAMILADGMAYNKDSVRSHALQLYFTGGTYITGGGNLFVQNSGYFFNDIAQANGESFYQYSSGGALNKFLTTTGNVQILGTSGVNLILANSFIQLSGVITGDLWVYGNIYSNGNLTFGLPKLNRVVPGAYPYTVLATDDIIGLNTSARREVLLPTAVGNTGKFFYFKDEFGAASTGVVTLIPNGAQRIDGQTGYSININRMAVALYSDNSNWFVV